jgi:predicted nucleic acid-binding protein
MNRVVVDTNVVSYVFKKDTRAERYRCHLEGKTLGISFMTLAELYRWAFESNWGENKRRQLEFHLRNHVVIPFDNEICALWARITADRNKASSPIGHADAWIAASALRYKAPLVTHNPKHFEGISGLDLISEVL